ncbi:Omp28-related outer membrane protein [Bacteroidia bacterium]|nr:Omp28-related outer membrane protein [Bacteroidia bacterium]
MNIKLNKIVALVVVAFAATLTGCGGSDGGSCPESKWYIDADGDGLGSASESKMSCTQPTGFVANSDDGVDMVIKKESRPIVFKITGETCYYCGDWGWQAWIDLSESYSGGLGLNWANYGTGFSNGFFRNQELNPTMDPMENMFEEGGGKPNFAANGKDYSTSYADAQAAADAYFAVPAQIAPALEASIDGESLTINVEAEVFEDISGSYYIGAYLIEDKVRGPQSGPVGTNGDVEHHMVMRGSLSPSAWGEEIVSASAATGDKFSQSFTVDIPATYNKENFYYGAIIWKKVGSKYTYVNCYTTQ